MSKQAETKATTTAVQKGVQWEKAKEKEQAQLWLFGESLEKAIASMEKDGAKTVRTQIAKAILRECEKPVNDATVKTMQNKISSALKCYREFKDIEAVKHFTMRELGGAKKKPAKKKGKFNAVEEAGKYCDNTRAERQALINALQATL